MKKKIRKIIVNDVTYHWNVLNGEDDLILQIWMDKKVIFEKLFPYYSDDKKHWDSLEECYTTDWQTTKITPQIVREIILENIQS